MSDLAIRVQNLSKQYRIGAREQYETLRDTLTDTLVSPFRWLRRLGDGRPMTEDQATRPPSPTRPPSSVLRLPTPSGRLKDISFEVKECEVVGIIGRNGPGKTELLKILPRITEPTEGHAEIDGRVGVYWK